MSSLFKDYGIGVGLRPCHYDVFLKERPSFIGWVEALTENYFYLHGEKTSRSRHTLRKIRRDTPVALHGVSMSLGSADKLDKNYMRQLRDLKNEIEPMWVSDHLCWTGVDGEHLHDLMPLPYTRETVRHVSRKIQEAQDYLGQRILIENVSSYAEAPHAEMTEWDFLNEIIRTADCGLLLDVNNVYVSAVNHGFDPLTYLRSLPAQRVGQIHLAGHMRKGDFLIDTHDSPVCDDVWALYRWVCRHIGSRSAMIERDQNIPEWAELSDELLHLRSLHEKESRPQVARLAEELQPSGAD